MQGGAPSNDTGDAEPKTAPSLLAVVVLYGMRAQSSPAVQALLAHAGHPDLLLWDNSPKSDAAPPTADNVLYHADPTNPGLAAAYNAALAHAEQRGLRWLLLLDQDTEVTQAFLTEVTQRTSERPGDIDAFVPLLRHRNAVVSPFTPDPIGPNKPLQPGRPLQAFNSGAVLRVAALRAMGGFDSRFPLDYLDHATFATLQRHGSRVQVLDASLEHPLSTDTGIALSPKERVRQHAILAAESRFLRLYGTPVQRWLHPVRLLRRAGSVAAHKHDWASALQVLRAVLPLEDA